VRGDNYPDTGGSYIIKDLSSTTKAIKWRGLAMMDEWFWVKISGLGTTGDAPNFKNDDQFNELNRAHKDMTTAKLN